MKRMTVLTLSVLLVAPLPALYAADAVQQTKPNIIMILADDVGPGDVHCTGGISTRRILMRWRRVARDSNTAMRCRSARRRAACRSRGATAALAAKKKL